MLPADRPAAPPRPPLRGPAGHRARRRRPGLPGAHEPDVRPDPVRPARLADHDRDRAVGAPAGELPASPTQSLTAARSLLKPGGTFAMYNYYEPFLLDRYANTLQDGLRHGAVRPASGRPLGRPPAGRADPAHGRAGAGDCTTTWHRATQRSQPATDDHPFPYLPTATIPRFYLLDAGPDPARRRCCWSGSRGGPLRQMRPYVDLFFMGAAFLLLETKNVVQFALLFGTTWLVNALVFAGRAARGAGLAIETARRVRLPRPVLLYAALLAALAAGLADPAGGAARPAGGAAVPGRRARSPSRRSSWPTWSSRSGSPTRLDHGRVRRRTCSARWSAARWSTWP